MPSWSRRHGVHPPTCEAEPRLDGERWARRYWLLAALVLGLAAFNLTYRVNRETITEWDESLYATSAWEMLQSGDWISTTFLGKIDYYNAKPPLNVWLIAISFKAFGISAASLRLTSILSAWLTVAFLVAWARRTFGDTTALLAGTVLATSFGFIYVHSARTANTDALFTLLMLLIVIVTHAQERHVWHRVWLGPLFAAVFLLRGSAILMPLVLLLATRLTRRHAPAPHAWRATSLALVGFVAPVFAWAIARWRIDQWQFFDKLWNYDLIARSTVALEGHAGQMWYYLDILQKYQYDWLAAMAIAALVVSPPVEHWRRWLLFWKADDRLIVLVGWWAVLSVLIPTVMKTKVSWYLDPFYPVFALAAGALLGHALSAEGRTAAWWRRTAVACAMVLAFGVAEGKLLWNSFHNRTPRRSVQGLLQAQRTALRGHAVFRKHWNHADRFVLIAMLGGSAHHIRGARGFIHRSQPGDYLITSTPVDDPRLVLVESSGPHKLYTRN